MISLRIYILPLVFLFAVIASSSKDTDSLYSHFDTLYFAGNYTEAMPIAHELLLEHDLTDWQESKLLTQQAIIFYKINDKSKAYELFDEAMEIAEDERNYTLMVDNLTNFALSVFRAGEYKVAATYLKTALDHSLKADKYRYNLICYYLIDLGEAGDELMETMDKDHELYYEFMFERLLDEFKLEEALVYLKKITMNPDNYHSQQDYVNYLTQVYYVYHYTNEHEKRDSVIAIIDDIGTDAGSSLHHHRMQMHNLGLYPLDSIRTVLYADFEDQMGWKKSAYNSLLDHYLENDMQDSVVALVEYFDNHQRSQIQAKIEELSILSNIAHNYNKLKLEKKYKYQNLRNLTISGIVFLAFIGILAFVVRSYKRSKALNKKFARQEQRKSIKVTNTIYSEYSDYFKQI